MADVNFVIGGTAAPFQSAMQKVTESAKESAVKVGESFGVEGVKGERALHGRFTAAFKDITANGANSAQAIGGAFENMAEGLKLSMGSMIALLAISELAKGFYAGYEAANKMKDAVKDALSIDTDVTKQSVEQVQDSIKKLKADADATNLASMSSMTAGATVFVQALEEGESIADVTREDAENYNRIKKEAHDLEDQAGAKEIDNANAVLELKIQGNDKEADALAHQQEMQDKLLDAQAKGNQAQIDALNKQIDLEAQLAAKKEEDAQAINDKKIADINKQIDAEEKKRSQIGENENQKLADATTQKNQDVAAYYGAGEKDGKTYTDEELLNLRLQMEKSITAEKEAQANVDKKNYQAFVEGNEKDAAQKKKQDEERAQRLKLLQEQQEAQVAVNAAGVDASLFHGEASSLAKTGLGGRVSGANYGNQAQLKAAQEAAKHLAEIKASITKLSGAVGIAQ